MRRFAMGLLGIGVAMVASLVAMDDAVAGRFGGGRSFGSRPSYSQPYRQTPATPASPQQPTAAPAPSPANGAAAPAPAPARSGWMGALGGMLGGLAIGGLIGSLLSGHGFGGFGLFDVLILGLVIFLVYKLFTMRRHTPQPVTASGPAYSPAPRAPEAAPAMERRSSAGFETDLLSRGRTESVASAVTTPDEIPEGAIMAGFDREGFMTGAKNAYARLQKAWDSGDLADIRQFTTDKVFGEVQDQMRSRPAGNRTDILEMNAKLIEAVEEGNDRVATVYFDVLLREYHDAGPLQPEPIRAREVWYFVQPKFNRQPTWYLDGLQQVEP